MSDSYAHYQIPESPHGLENALADTVEKGFTGVAPPPVRKGFLYCWLGCNYDSPTAGNRSGILPERFPGPFMKLWACTFWQWAVQMLKLGPELFELLNTKREHDTGKSMARVPGTEDHQQRTTGERPFSRSCTLGPLQHTWAPTKHKIGRAVRHTTGRPRRGEVVWSIRAYPNVSLSVAKAFN